MKAEAKLLQRASKKIDSRVNWLLSSKSREPCGGVEVCGGVLGSVGECDGVCWSDEMKCDGWLH